MHYSSEQKAEIERGWKGLSKELRDVWVFLAGEATSLLTQEQAQEHIRHGAARRLLIIQRCLENIFRVFPVRRTVLLSDDERSDLEINLHAFLINSHGLPDNLAWAYILERKIEINFKHVGLFTKNTQQHLPDEVRAYLTSGDLSTWHSEYAKNYRDALAHRIPPYVPPSLYTPIHQQEYQELHVRSSQAMKDGNSELAIELELKKHKIGIICPVFMHSFLDRDAQKPILLHPQLIADCRTVIQIINMVRPHLALPKDSDRNSV